jgi:DNA-binding response OmpR family regulator
LDAVSATIQYADRRIRLTRTEFRIVAALAAAPDTTSQDEVCATVWGNELAREKASALRSHLYGIRAKLSAAQVPDQLIESIRGRGLRLAPWAR